MAPGVAKGSGFSESFNLQPARFMELMNAAAENAETMNVRD